MYTIIRTEGYLEHHGIKGQKWGVKNGPPYPLDSNARSSSEKEVGMVAELAPVALYAAAMTAFVVAVRVANNKADERRTKEYEEQYYGKRKIKSLDDAPKIDPSSMSMDEHMKAVNPDYPEFGSTENCMFCTTAMAMRMKGYDVEAEKSPAGWSAKNLEENFENAEAVEPKCKTTSDLENYIANQGDGAFGNLVVFWQYGGGHSMFYKVDNGQVKIYDTQANKVRDIRDFKGAIIPKASEVIRLDDKNPTERALGAVKPREERKST